MSTQSFPFSFSDLDGWVFQYKDGSVTRFSLEKGVAQPGRSGAGFTVAASASAASNATTSLSGYCKHDPAPYPVFTHRFKDNNGVTREIDLYIADSLGAKNHYTEFDVAIDGGQVIYPFAPDHNAVLKGDPIFINKLKSYELVEVLKTRILRIEWLDRQAPDLIPAFWPALASTLEQTASYKAADDTEPLKVLCICQGGHGRSGSSLTALMMVWSDYSPLDAITHLRAVHCPRAIESQVQHKYLDDVGKLLGRPANSLEAEKVKDFRARFMTLTSEFAKPYQERFKTKKAK